MLKKLVFIPLYLLLSMVIYISCSPEEKCSHSCCGETFTQSYFQHSNIQVYFKELVDFSPARYQDSAYDIGTRTFSGTDVMARDLAITFRFETEYYTENVVRPTDFSLISSAYACRPPAPQSEERIDSISIIANTAYDSSHPAGSELNELFQAAFPLPYSSYKVYAAQAHFNFQPFDDYREYYLIPAQYPAQQDTFTFDINLYQTGPDGPKVFHYKTDSVVLEL